MPPNSRRNPLGATFAFAFCIAGGTYALWLAATGPRLSGGIPWLLPDAWNQMLGRVMFGVCGLISFGVAMLAWRDIRRK